MLVSIHTIDHNVGFNLVALLQMSDREINKTDMTWLVGPSFIRYGSLYKQLQLYEPQISYI